MLYDCSLVNPTSTGNWLRATFSARTLPPAMLRELQILFQTPGFAPHWLMRALDLNVHYTNSAIHAAPSYQDEALDNWNSITHDDAVKLASYRTLKGHMPTICKTFIAEDTQNMKPVEIMRKWKCSDMILKDIRHFGPFARDKAILPDWFQRKIIC